MDDFGMILLEGIAAVSVLACIAYLILRARQYANGKTQLTAHETFGKQNVIVRYDGNDISMNIYFCADGLLLERVTGEQMRIPTKNIVSISKQSTDVTFIYSVEFAPDDIARDRIELLSEADITDMLLKVVPQDKFVADVCE